jgi:hypothetical protein
LNNFLQKSIQVFPQGLWSVCFFFVLSALYLGNLENFLFVERDLIDFFIPTRQFWVEEVKNFNFPLWNPYYYNGSPLFATLQAGVLYPFSVFYLFLPFHWAFNLNIVIHFALSGWFTYLLLRGMKASQSAALFSGIGFMLSGYLLSVHCFLSTLFSVAWVPLYFLTFLTAIKNNSTSYAILSGFIGTFMFLGGGVETCYLVFGLTFLITLFPHYLFEKEVSPNFKRRIFLFALFSLIFFGLSAVQLLPFMELSSLTNRSTGLSPFEAGLWSLHPLDLIELLIPDQYGLGSNLQNLWKYQNWLKTIYLGSIPFLFSLYFLKGNKKFLFGFIFAFSASLLLALGNNTPFHDYLYDYLPLFNKLRYPVKFIFLAILLLCITAGLGFDSFKLEAHNPKNEGFLTMRLYLVLGFLCMIAFGLLNLFHNEFVIQFKSIGWDEPKFNAVDHNLLNLKRLLIFTSLICLCIFLYFQPLFRKSYILISIISIFTLDLFFSNYSHYQKIEVGHVNQIGENAKFLQSDPSFFRFYLTPKTRINTIEMENPEWDRIKILKEKFLSGMLGNTKIFQSQGIGVLRRIRWENVNKLIDSAPNLETTPLLNLMNVKYIVSKGNLFSPNFKHVHTSYPVSQEQMEKANLKEPYSIKIYENINVLPRAFLVSNCKIIKKEEDFKKVFLNKQFDPETFVLIEKKPKNYNCGHGEKKSAHDSVTITSYKSNTVDLKISSSGRQFLFLGDSFYPGWKVFVDGEKKEILRANYLFRAVLIGPGKHKVQFVYDPFSFKLGMTITLLTMLVCLIYFVKIRLDRPSRNKTSIL